MQALPTTTVLEVILWMIKVAELYGRKKKGNLTHAYNAAGPPSRDPRCVIGTDFECPSCRSVGVVGISAWRSVWVCVRWAEGYRLVICQVLVVR